jgi:predicted HD phosphohydrolase
MKDGNASLGIVGHEGIGAAYLKKCGMPSLVCELVYSHVAAKRYLCTVSDNYYDKLSDASKETMKLQGGVMNNEQIKEFTSGFMPELKIYLREYDDYGKQSTQNKNNNKSLGIENYSKYIEKALFHGGFFV